MTTTPRTIEPGSRERRFGSKCMTQYVLQLDQILCLINVYTLYKSVLDGSDSSAANMRPSLRVL